ncbi:ADP-ribosylglycohydrolase [Labilithrix luteola]|uniref:ADP-ribosylglycohydrolase n=2 Tax=Labilithrix luteola TaxID=1391654 RepID=A0A0K1QCQ2_9BACT|nr:ADP-ribosylglycohydrolase [Labilithrix luteola]
MTPSAIRHRWPTIDRYSLFGKTGFSSDDTEQTALVAQALARHPGDLDLAVRAFRRSMLGWFLRLPWGIGLGTLRACLRMAFGFENTGVASAGNGAAMRAAVLGVRFREDATERRRWADAFARVTHRDARAVEGARFVAELGALASTTTAHADREKLALSALTVVDHRELRAAIERGISLASSTNSDASAAIALGTTGFVVHSVSLATFFFVRHGTDATLAIVETIRAGGDTDTNAAIVGAWCGALHGEAGLPSGLVERLQDGPFGRSHLRALARALEATRLGAHAEVPRFSWMAAFVRNVLLFPIVLVHALRVALSWTTSRDGS